MPVTTSDTRIANLALTRLGHFQIQSLDSDVSKEGRILRANYEHIRDLLLRSHPWNWAIKRQTLAASATAPNHEFTYAFPLPADCLKVVQCDFEQGVTYFDGVNGQYVLPAEYRVELVAGQRCIITDESSCKIEYISQVTDTAIMDQLFIDLFVARLAAECAFSITQNRGVTKDMWELYQAKWQEATGTDAQEGTPRAFIVDTWLGARQ